MYEQHIAARRKAAYNDIMTNRPHVIANRGYTDGWRIGARHVFAGVNYALSDPVQGDTVVAGLIVATRPDTSGAVELVGQVRSLVPNKDPWDDYPWMLQDSGTPVRAAVVNDAVEPGDMVWIPGAGDRRVTSVSGDEDGITSITTGVATRGTWFRVAQHNITNPPPSSRVHWEAPRLVTWEEEAKALKKSLDDLWAALQREAARRDWCGEYDEFAKAHGGPARKHPHEIDIDVTTGVDADEVLRIMKSYFVGTNDVEAHTDMAQVEIQYRVSLTVEIAADEEGNWDDIAERALQEHNVEYSSYDVVGNRVADPNPF